MRPGRPRRRAARVVVLDPRDRLLLINAQDPMRRGATWWEIPGGGMDPGERTEDTVRRELWEEAGISDAAIGPCVWTQTVRFSFAGLHFDQDEWIHVARCDGAAARPGGLEALEALAFGEQRWWTIDDLTAESPRTIPYRLGEFVGTLVGWRPGEDPPDEPIDITPSERQIATWAAADG